VFEISLIDCSMIGFKKSEMGEFRSLYFWLC
jgi:hypothetical protein